MGTAFWLAWTIGVAGPTTAFVVAAEQANAADDDSRAIGVGEIAVGLAFLAIAVRLAAMPRRGRSGAISGWLEVLDRSGPSRAAGLGLALSAANPKNLALMLAAAVAIARAGEGNDELTFATVGFVSLGASTVSLLLVGSVVFPRWSGGALSGLRAVVTRNDRTIAIVLGFAIGAFFVLDGVRAL